MGQNSRGQVQQKMAEEKQERARDRLLQGIVSASEPAQAGVQLVSNPQGWELVLGIGYEELKAEIERHVAEDIAYIEIRTFTWMGDRADEQVAYNRTWKVSEILGVVEVDSDAWDRIVSDVASRASQMAAQRMQGQGMAIPPGVGGMG